MKFDHSSNPAFNEKYFEECIGSAEVMTIDGTINKSLILMALMFCSATFTWKMTFGGSADAMSLCLFGCISAFIVSLITIFVRRISHITAPIYAILEGLALGSISANYELSSLSIQNGQIVAASEYSGIVLNALGITIGIMFLMLVLYRFKIINVDEKLKSGIMIATGGVALGYIFSFVSSLLGFGTMNFLSSGFGIIASLGIAAIAAFNFLLDFNQIERGVEKKSPVYMEWYCAFGLMLTLVWLYLEILKLLSRFSSRK